VPDKIKLERMTKVTEVCYPLFNSVAKKSAAVHSLLDICDGEFLTVKGEVDGLHIRVQISPRPFDED